MTRLFLLISYLIRRLFLPRVSPQLRKYLYSLIKPDYRDQLLQLLKMKYATPVLILLISYLIRRLFLPRVSPQLRKYLYPLIKPDYRDQLQLQLLKMKYATPVLIDTPTKVSSSSVFESLLKQYPGPVLKRHGGGSFADSKCSSFRYLHHLIHEEKRPLNVISLVREPISRNISHFFHDLGAYTGIPDPYKKLSITELKDSFLSSESLHESFLGFFENNMLVNFGIDVFSTPFPESGISTYSNGNVRLLVMRMEISDNDKVEAIKSFLGLENFSLYHHNIGEKKHYVATYRKFKDEVKLPPDYIDGMCETRWFRHFYGTEYINTVKERFCMPPHLP